MFDAAGKRGDVILLSEDNGLGAGVNFAKRRDIETYNWDAVCECLKRNHWEGFAMRRHNKTRASVKFFVEFVSEMINCDELFEVVLVN